MKIGVLGGTFDPPHFGHLKIAEAAHEELGLDEVMFIPANRSPMKEDQIHASPRHRLAMTSLLVRNVPYLSVCDLEIAKGGLSYTVETLTELALAQPAEYWFILGGDAARTLPTWKHPDRIIRLVNLAIAPRTELDQQVILHDYPEEWHSRVHFLNTPLINLSSTQVRSRVRTGESLKANLSPEIIDYIHKNKLYKPA